MSLPNFKWKTHPGPAPLLPLFAMSKILCAHPFHSVLIRTNPYLSLFFYFFTLQNSNEQMPGAEKQKKLIPLSKNADTMLY